MLISYQRLHHSGSPRHSWKEPAHSLALNLDLHPFLGHHVLQHWQQLGLPPPHDRAATVPQEELWRHEHLHSNRHLDRNSIWSNVGNFQYIQRHGWLSNQVKLFALAWTYFCYLEDFPSIRKEYLPTTVVRKVWTLHYSILPKCHV